MLNVGNAAHGAPVLIGLAWDAQSMNIVDQQDDIRRILSYTKRIAVVGLSPDPDRPSHGVARRLLSRGYDIVPVNPEADEVLGLHSYPSLEEVPGDVDLVDVFRRSEFLVEVAQAAAEVGARALWLQSGLRSEEARQIAETAGMDVVEDRCLGVEVAKLNLAL